jgi:hypothetical protein
MEEFLKRVVVGDWTCHKICRQGKSIANFYSTLQHVVTTHEGQYNRPGACLSRFFLFPRICWVLKWMVCEPTFLNTVLHFNPPGSRPREQPLAWSAAGRSRISTRKALPALGVTSHAWPWAVAAKIGTPRSRAPGSCRPPILLNKSCI